MDANGTPTLFSTRSLLEKMGMPELGDVFEGCGISADQFLNLSVMQIQLILPESVASFVVQLQFMQNYLDFLTSNNLAVHPSILKLASPHPTTAQKICSVFEADNRGLNLSNEAEGSTSALSPSSKDDDEGLDVNGSKGSTSTSLPTGDDKEQRPADENSLFNSDSESDKSDSDNSKSSRLPHSKQGQPSITSEGSDSGLQDSTRVSSEDSSDSDYSDGESPQVDRSQLGLNRKKARSADAKVKDLNLKIFLKSIPMCKAVIKSYRKTGNLNEDDRRTICKEIVQWLMRVTDYRPKGTHYQVLCDKIVALFPKEKTSMWYIPPKSEGQKQRCAKGKLVDKVRNVKSKLRRKGHLKASTRNKNKNKTVNLTNIRVPYSVEENASREWLKRNNSKFSDVREHWAKCRVPRLKELYNDASLTPAKYSSMWNDVLKLSDGYELILDDFESLSTIFPQKYSSLEGKTGSLLECWSEFSQKIITIIDSCGLSKKEVEEWKEKLAMATNENTKDYLIMRLLPFICKLKCIVKVGSKSRRPSAIESQKAFFLHFTVAGEFEEERRKRTQRYRDLKATVQPYIAVQGHNENTVTASYVVVNDLVWKTSSVLQAIDICFKSHYSLNCEYNPEAKHLWLLIQHALYRIELDEDLHFTSVTDLLGKLL